jgi:hypothetical protein
VPIVVSEDGGEVSAKMRAATRRKEEIKFIDCNFLLGQRGAVLAEKSEFVCLEFLVR